MARKFTYRRLGNLWKEGSQTPKVSRSTKAAFIKKSIDDVCLQADLAESAWDYSFQICSGMVRLLAMGLSQSDLVTHRTLVQKLLRLGRDIMDYANSDTDFFFLGAFVDLKICSKWRNIEFYRFIVDALKGIKKHLAFFSDRIKKKILKEYKRLYPQDFLLYFTPKYSNSA